MSVIDYSKYNILTKNTKLMFMYFFTLCISLNDLIDLSEPNLDNLD